MTESLHSRAQQLFAESLAEAISPADRAWLDQHLRDCPDCAREILHTQELLGALRSVPIFMPRDLAARTQLRVRLRAQESAQTSHSGLLLWLITAMSWLLGIFSAPLVWRAFAWVGAEFSLPKLVLEIGFVLWWTVPPLLAAGVVLHQKALAAEWSLKK
jgi:anti-sigma factor RsiW